MNTEVLTPFSVKTPERLTPTEVSEQFVDHEAYQKLTPPGHTFIQGPRGSGKSMLFRYMSPATQCVVKGCNLSEIPYVAINLPVKQGNVQIQEINRLSSTQSRLIAENLLVAMIATQICKALLEVYDHISKSDETLKDWSKSIADYISDHITKAGYIIKHPNSNLSDTPRSNLVAATEWLISVEEWTQDYLNGLSFCADNQIPSFGKKFLNYQFFLFPLFKLLQEQYKATTPPPFYVLVDDADWLREEQTRVLNTWISFRTSDVISFKVATQFDYKTFFTTGTRRIESPHDFNRVNLSTIYTAGSYRDWVKNVVDKRLTAFGISLDAYSFFPEDAQQLNELESIQKEIESAGWDGPKSQRRKDDSYRYARPELIRRRIGRSYTYIYSGFNQLVDLSNATIRFFLEAASEMYAKEQSNSSTVTLISPQIQNSVLRELAENLMHSNFDEIVRDYSFEDSDPDLIEKVKQVRNLVNSMGAAFYASLIHPTRSERRVLAFALQNNADDRIQDILRLAVSLNFFTEGSLGKKEGFGRTRRYVLNRRLAPFFNLDPSGFSGYFWVTNDFLKIAIDDPTKARDEIKKRLSINNSSTDLQLQLPIDDLSDQSEFLDIQEVVYEED